MQKREQLYEGKAKRVYATADPNVVIVSYKDVATAFDGLKKGIIEGKGAVNNRMTNCFMKKLAEVATVLRKVWFLTSRSWSSPIKTTTCTTLC